MKKRFFGLLTAAVIAAAAVPVMHVSAADTEYAYQHEDGTFEYGWNYNGQGKYDFWREENGSVYGSWEEISTCLFQKGIRFPEPVHPEQGSLRVTYNAELIANGTCSYGIHGFSGGDYTVDSYPIEFYVIEGWNEWELPAGAQAKGTVTVGDQCYDLYESFHTIQTGIERNYGYMQYWSVRQNNAFEPRTLNVCAGTVALDEHIRAWQSLGAKFDKYAVAQVYFEAEAVGESEGDANGSCSIMDVDVTFTEPAAAEAVTGDATCDGTVDVADAVLILRYAIADAEAKITDQGVKNGDVNASGQTDADDAALVLQFIARKITF